MKLLSPASTNAKTAKNEKFTEYLSAILHLAPYNLSGINVCPAASKGCSMACLNTAGRGKFDNVQQARIRKTKYYFSNQQQFLADLCDDINSLKRKATKEKRKAVVRLNGTSDIDWENIKVTKRLDNLIIHYDNIFKLFPDVQFYDYTKRVSRLKMSDLPSNYYLVFSMSEVNEVVAKRVLSLGFNVAVVFRKLIPNSWQGIKVINGDEHDLRFIEGYQGSIIGLKAKGKATKDTTGFVKDIAV